MNYQQLQWITRNYDELPSGTPIGSITKTQTHIFFFYFYQNCNRTATFSGAASRYLHCPKCCLFTLVVIYPTVAGREVTFLLKIISILIFLAMLGILNGSLSVWIVFVVIYSLLCAYISFKIYFISFVFDGFKQLKRSFQSSNTVEAIAPIRKSRFALLVIANVINYAMLITGLCLYNTGVTDFGTFLLGLLMGNSVLYAVFYTGMKVHTLFFYNSFINLLKNLSASQWWTNLFRSHHLRNFGNCSLGYSYCLLFRQCDFVDCKYCVILLEKLKYLSKKEL